MRRIAAAAAGLVAACHPGPTAVVTVFAMAWSLVGVGLGPGRAGLVGAAVLLGQLSIGWSNDRIDARRDVAAARQDKPIAAGRVGATTVAVASGAALIGCVVASLGLGLAAGTVHLVAVASAWTYNLAAKYTVASPAPFALSFALLPAVATLAAAPPRWPAPAVMLAGGALGVAAHFANTVGDVEADAATGVRGLPQRMGPARSMAVMAAFVLLAAVALLVSPGRPGPVGVALAAAGAAVAAVGVLVRGRRAFPVTLAAVGLVVAALLVSG